MSKVNRNRPVRSRASESTYSLMEFTREFPDDAACLDWLWRNRLAPDGSTAECPKCGRPRKFHRVKSRPSYSCDTCGHHLHPTAGTIFHKSATSLQLWFYVLYLMTSTRCGVSAKHVEREIGVGYKTAWRMCNLIRNHLMEQYDDWLDGDVEVDETLIGGRPKVGQVRDRREARMWAERKAKVVAAVERGGRVRVTVVPDSSAATLGDVVQRFVAPGARLLTDEWRGYREVGKRYASHDRVNHRDNEYVRGNVHTNTIEGFFGNVKTGIAGNYHGVSAKWLQGYLNEYAWRYNHRHSGRAMFRSLLLRTVVVSR